MVLGDRVRFTRAGSDHVYKGVVVEVVPAMAKPRTSWITGNARETESFVVRVGRVMHWPENIRYL